MASAISKISIEKLLRSINIIYDSDQPDRIEHFRPTAKAIALIEKLLLDPIEKAFFVAAPYGSGKTLTLTYIIQLLENHPSYKKMLRSVAKRADEIAPNFYKYVLNRTRSGQQGIGVALQGYQEDLPDAILRGIQTSLNRIGYRPDEVLFDLDFSTLEDCLASLQYLQAERMPGIDQILIVWDEFGRHIEGLVGDGRADELNHIQTVAEFASRTKRKPVSLALVMHQSLMNYAGKAPQSVKKEWKKIEGRFQTIQYIDDSKEIYRLIADVIMGTQGGIDLFEEKSLNRTIPKIRTHKLFDDFTDDELLDLLRSSWPLTPVALYLLPRLSSRVAQHERTLFTFLNSVDLQKTVTVSSIYDYFSPSMSKDTELGGSYHMWLESQSALSKTDDGVETELIKTACLLSIGLSGERARVSKDYLEFAGNGYWNDNEKIKTVIDGLIAKKLFLYRKNSDSISLWHGTDINIAERLEEEKAKHVHSFQLSEFLSNEVEPENWKPIEYNSENAIQRYYRGIYLSIDQLNSLIQEKSFTEGPQAEEDGRIYYIITQNSEERSQAIEHVCKFGQHEQYVWLIPSRDINIFDIALEVYSYYKLQENSDLINTDPLILPELEHLTDDANEYLHRMVELAFYPSTKGPEIYYRGRKSERSIESAKDFRHFLTLKTRKNFDKTPYINNEMINRKYPRKTLINARKKLVFGILERTGQPSLGLDGFTPDVSMFRTILLHSGLYRPIVHEADNSWRFALPEEIEDKALAKVWEKIRVFLTNTGKNKSFDEFFTSLKKPPFGVRSGIIPILFAAGMRAFPSAFVIKDKKGNYLEDILPSTIEDICQNPCDFSISVEELNENRKRFLTGIYSLFTKGELISSNEMDLLRQCYDAVEYWKTTISPAALETRRLSPDARRFQEALRKAKDPETLFFTSIPSIISSTDITELLEFVRNIRDELETVVHLFYRAAFQSTLGALQFTGSNGKDIQIAAKNWAGFFSDTTIETITDGMTKSFMTRMKMPYESGEQLVDSISSLLIGRPVMKWDDSSIAAYEREIHDVVNRMEEHALHTGIGSERGEKSGLVNLVEARIHSLTKKLNSIAGEEEVRKVLKDLLKEY
jgi:hypothetical protein